MLKQVTLAAHHVPTEKTRHYQGNDLLPPASILKIVKYDDDDGYYLLYFDAAGKELTDTYHETMTAAMGQAEWEYRVKQNEWQAVHQEN